MPLHPCTGRARVRNPASRFFHTVTLAAAIDLGTNTVRLLIADISPEGSLAPIRRERIITRLGEGFHRSGCISEAASARSLEALHTFQRIISQYGVARLFPVATSVVRDAGNGREFIARAAHATGISIKIASGTEEAYLTHAGVLSLIAAPERCTVVDIGGGSTELVLSDKGVPARTASIPLGVVHLAERLLLSDPPAAPELTLLKSFIRKQLSAHLIPAFSPSPDLAGPQECSIPLLGTAGTITTLAAIDQHLRHYDPDRINGYRLWRRRIAAIYRHLCGLPACDRTALPGMERGREDLIVPGALLLMEIMRFFRSEIITVSDGGLLEGILVDAHRTHRLDA